MYLPGLRVRPLEEPARRDLCHRQRGSSPNAPTCGFAGPEGFGSTDNERLRSNEVPADFAAARSRCRDGARNPDL